MIWEKVETNPAEVKELARQFDLNLIISSVLVRRNLTDVRSVSFLLEDDLRFLHNPFLFQDMEIAVKRINRALKAQEKIMVFGDRDVDGITAMVLLVQMLKGLGARVEWRLPTGEEDYGLSVQVIESIAEIGINILITTDCGISNIKEIELANRMGIETIILDHHNPQSSLPEAVAIINPKLKECGYPFRDLSGCAVAAKFSWALYFSNSSLFGKPVWLLHLKPDNEVFSATAVKLVNLVERERIVESVVPGLLDVKKTRLFKALAGCEVLVYEIHEQKKLLDKIGVSGIKLKDIQPLLKEHFPSLAGKSLLKIKEMSRIAVYEGSKFGEIDMLVSLFNTLAFKRERTLPDAQLRVMDLLALGTLADIMPLVDENRIIVKKGLEIINQMNRCGLRELIINRKLYGKRLTATDIAWQISPVLNSAGRMGEPEKAAELLLSENPEEAAGLVDYIVKLNRKRKNLGDKIWGACFNTAKQNYEKTGSKFTLICNPEIPRGITGIFAARLSSFFKVPAIVVAVSPGKAVGSLRSPYRIADFLDLFADLLLSYGGHDRAAGFSLESSQLPQFEKRFYSIVEEYSFPDQLEEKLAIDAEVPPSYLNPDLIRVVEFFEPYGAANPPLMFLTRGVSIESLDIIGKKEVSHVKMLLGAGRYKWPAIYWNAADRAGRDFDVSDTVDIVFRLARNYFQNTESLQLTILDLKKWGE